ncbi:MAG: DinB family protein [Acidimicrobiales bacterium]
MSSPSPPTIPALVTDGDERATLESFLEFFRAVLVHKMHGLDAAELSRPLPRSASGHGSPLTLGGLWSHMAYVEDVWFPVRLLGGTPSEPWASAPWDDDHDWELHAGAELPPEELATRFDEAVGRSRAAAASIDSLDTLTVRPASSGAFCSLRWVLVHMIEEYARHCGHADLLREAIDGATDS